MTQLVLIPNISRLVYSTSPPGSIIQRRLGHTIMRNSLQTATTFFLLHPFIVSFNSPLIALLLQYFEVYTLLLKTFISNNCILCSFHPVTVNVSLTYIITGISVLSAVLNMFPLEFYFPSRFPNTLRILRAAIQTLPNFDNLYV